MNEGGKVVFSGRNGWVQQTSTSTGLNTYSGYTLVAGAGVRLRLPAGPGGRRRPSAHGVLPRAGHLQRLGPVVARRRRRARAASGTTTYNAAAVQPGDGRLPRRDAADRARHHGRRRATRSSRRRTRRRARPEPRAEVADAPAHRISSVTDAAAVPPGAGRGRLRRPDDRQRRGDHLHARLRRRSASAWSRSPTPASANELVRRMMAPPAADDGRHDGADGHVAAARRRGDGQRRRPGRDRGRGGRRARRPQGGPPAASAARRWQRKVSFPFQMRWQPTADDIGDTVTLSVDGRGQGRQRHDVARGPSRSARRRRWRRRRCRRASRRSPASRWSARR